MAQSGDSSVQCEPTGICTLQRTLINDQGNPVIVPYKFKYRPAQNGAPTVVYIPGGPGGSSTQINMSEAYNIPKNFGVIQTDPLFVGVNQNKDMNSFRNTTHSEQVAKDIELALKSVGASDVIVFGVSYGTVPGTILASQLSQQGKAPRAVILDGTAGKSLTNAQAIQGFAKEWSLLTAKVDSGVVAAFNQLIKRMIQRHQITAEEMGTILQLTMMQRKDSRGESLWEPLLQLAVDNPKQLIQILLRLKSKVTAPDSPDRMWFHGIIGCRELFPESNAETENFSFDGKLSATPLIHDCAKYAKPEEIHLYDSKNYQISAPVIYLQGENDPATPTWQAQYHASNQKNMNRRLLIVPNGGHGMLNSDLKNCSENFFLALQQNPSTASNSLMPCISNQGKSSSQQELSEGAL
ncbi:MAG: alpha/beta fold hydrolase [Pseudobdellovibrionaceae bacterium]